MADFANHRGMRRARCLSVVAVSFFISQLVGLRVQDIKHLQYAVLLVGVSYGGVFGLIPTIVIEWFGMGPSSHLFLLILQELTHPSDSVLSSSLGGRTAHFGQNLGLVSVSPIVAGNIFSMIFGRVFDANSSHGEHGMNCFEGARCYSTSLYVTTSACLCALVLAIFAAKRDQNYR